MLDVAPALKHINKGSHLYIRDIVIASVIDFTHLAVDQQSEQSFACMYGVAKIGVRRSSFHIRVVQSAQEMKYLG